MNISQKIDLRFELFLVSLLSLIILSIGLWYNRDFFLLTRELSEYTYLYDISQYVLGDANENVMGDGDLYTFAGISYITGVSPVDINFEHPPLLKYVYGLSYRLFEAPNWITLVFVIVAIICFYYLLFQLINTWWLRIIGFVMFLGNPLMLSFISQTMLDFPMTTLSLLFVSSYVFYSKKVSLYRAAGVGIAGGLLIASKYPFPILLILVALVLFHSLVLYRKYVHVFVSSGFIVLVYLLTYAQFFLLGNSIFDFINFEKYRLSWYMGKTDNPKGLLLQTIFFGKHRQWWHDSQELVYYREWNILWPLVFITYLLSLILAPLKSKHALFPYFVWLPITFLAYLVGVSEARFLVLLWPGWVLFSMHWLDTWLLPKLK